MRKKLCSKLPKLCAKRINARCSNTNACSNESRRLAQALGTARELTAVFRGLREFTNVSVPCNGFFVSLYDPVRDVRTACYGWADGDELDVSELPPMPVTTLVQTVARCAPVK